MCGIAGIFFYRRRGEAAGAGSLAAMTDSLAHRGPDGRGIWFSSDRMLGLGHRRLSILDLSSAGSQPMVSPDGRLAV
ncbi:MAG: asparagine synthetase B, partial [Chloroflexota bacterium]